MSRAVFGVKFIIEIEFGYKRRKKSAEGRVKIQIEQDLFFTSFGPSVKSERLGFCLF